MTARLLLRSSRLGSTSIRNFTLIGGGPAGRQRVPSRTGRCLSSFVTCPAPWRQLPPRRPPSIA
eukprot:1983455-Lingulodinium_polyedra.AAC.1